MLEQSVEIAVAVLATGEHHPPHFRAVYQIARLVKALFAIDFRSEWTRAVPESQQPLGVNMFPLGVNVVTAE